MQTFIVTQPCQKGKLRLDAFISSALHISRNQANLLIKHHLVSINNQICAKSGTLLKLEDSISIAKPTLESSADSTKNTESSADSAYFKDISIIYEDNDMLIINKPPHIVIHEAPSVKSPTLTQWLRANSHILHTLSGEKRYGIIHRLDKETSGALAIAKSHLAYKLLPEALKSRTMGRYYLAIIDKPLKQNLALECLLARHPSNRLKMAKVLPKAKNATLSVESSLDSTSNGAKKGARLSKSAFIKLATSLDNSLELIAIKLYTGRTHQIRAHLESLNRHILGDSLYGYKPSKDSSYSGRILLHAYILYLNHPHTKQNCIFKAPILQDMLEFLQTNFEYREGEDEKSLARLLEPKHIMDTFNHFEQLSIHQKP